MQDKTILRVKDICAILRIGTSTFYRWIKTGHFPKGIKFGPSRVGWERQTVEAWIAEKKNASTAQ